MTSAQSPLFLLPPEVETLTGFKSAARQVRWLSTKGWRFVQSGSGRPIVARKYAENMLGCQNMDDDCARPLPNFGALLRAA